MRSDKYTKRDLDEETADLIDSKYPTEPDVERIFRKSYREFKKAEKTADRLNEDIVGTVEVVKPKRKYIFSLSGLCAVLCGVMMIIMLHGLINTPDRGIDTPEDTVRIPVASTTDTTNASADSTAAEAKKTTANTVVTTVTTAMVVSESSEIKGTDTDASNNGNIEAETATQPKETEMHPETTNYLPETTVTVSTTAVQTMTEPVTTERKDDPCGYFTVQEFEENRFSSVRYVRTNTEPISMIDHSVGADFYSCTVLSEYPGASKVLEIKTREDSPPMLFQELSYNYFHSQIDNTSEITYTEINGRPALLSRSSASYCLIWDDGCHICSLVMYEPDYDYMYEFANNYK